MWRCKNFISDRSTEEDDTLIEAYVERCKGTGRQAGPCRAQDEQVVLRRGQEALFPLYLRWMRR